MNEIYKCLNEFIVLVNLMIKYKNLKFIFFDNKQEIKKKYINLNLKKFYEFKDLNFKKKDKKYLFSLISLSNILSIIFIKFNY